MKTSVTPLQLLLIILVVPVTTFALLNWLNPSKLSVFLVWAGFVLLVHVVNFVMKLLCDPMLQDE